MCSNTIMYVLCIKYLLCSVMLLYCGRAPGIPVHTYHGGSARERARATAKIQRRGGVLLTSYGMIVSSAELIAKKDGESFGREFKYVSLSCDYIKLIKYTQY